MMGDEKINMKVGEKIEVKPLAMYDKADFKVTEKTFKAMKFVMSELGPSNKRNVLSSKTTKEKWEKRDKIVSLMQDYYNLSMKDKEEIEDFQARFLTLINSLTHLGEEILN